MIDVLPLSLTSDIRPPYARDRIVIWDIDNCLSNDESRIELIDWSKQDPDERYAAYHAPALHDLPDNQSYYYAYYRFVPMFVTARPAYMHVMTREWLQQHFPHPKTGLLCMRPSGDHRPSAELKVHLIREAMARYRISRSQLHAGFDDRLDVLQAYEREFGILTRRIRIHRNNYMPKG